MRIVDVVCLLLSLAAISTALWMAIRVRRLERRMSGTGAAVQAAAYLRALREYTGQDPEICALRDSMFYPASPSIQGYLPPAPQEQVWPQTPYQQPYPGGEQYPQYPGGEQYPQYPGGEQYPPYRQP